MRRIMLALLVGLCVTLPVAAARGITVHAGASGSRLSFQPASITAGEGERVDLTLVNDDPSTPHDWAALEYGGRDVEVYVRGGETRSVSFTANEVGEFRIVCQVVGHKQQGMEGTLIVKGKLFAPAPGVIAVLSLAALALLVGRTKGREGGQP